jgi:hypothetical protein
MTWESIGLCYYVFISVGQILVLLYDVYLAKTHQTMITTYTRNHPWAMWAICTLNISGVIALGMHFMGTNP